MFKEYISPKLKQMIEIKLKQMVKMMHQSR